MAYFPIYRYNVYDDPGRRYFGDQLDFFDPWSDLRSSSPTTVVLVPPNFRWVNQPLQRRPSAGLTQQTDKQQQRPSTRTPHLEKYRVQYNVAGFNPETIKTRVEGQKVVIEAKQEDRLPDGDYNIREVRKSCPLPEHADTSRLVSYVTPNRILVIEVPIKNPENERRHSETEPSSQNVAQFGEHRDPLFNYGAFLSGSSFEPKIVTTSDNKKQLSMSLEMKNFAPDEIKVSVKNNELIVKGEHRNQDDKYSGRTFFFKSVALPPGTRVEQLQSYLTAESQLKIEVPYEDQKSETTPAQEQKSESEKTDEKTDS